MACQSDAFVRAFRLMQKLSIITAIHNALPMNRLYWKALHENTLSAFELIIIDNHSTDGSELFFKSLAETTRNSHHEVIYARNEFNQPYPTSQLQAMALARYEMLCFFNNDIWMPKGWEVPFQRKLSENKLLILSPSGQEAQPTQALSDALKKKWKQLVLLSKIWKFCFLKSEEDRLWKALTWMYQSLDPFHSPNPTNGKESMNGIKGDAVVCHRDLPKTLG